MASMCVDAKSHATTRPQHHGSSDTPSGHFPSLREILRGSSLDGTPADLSASCITLLQVWWRVCPLLIMGQVKTWFPKLSLVAPQMQEHSLITGALNRREAEIRKQSSDISRPKFAEGSAFSQSPEPVKLTPLYFANSVTLISWRRRILVWRWIGSNHDFCLEVCVSGM